MQTDVAVYFEAERLCRGRALGGGVVGSSWSAKQGGMVGVMFCEEELEGKNWYSQKWLSCKMSGKPLRTTNRRCWRDLFSFGGPRVGFTFRPPTEQIKNDETTIILLAILSLTKNEGIQNIPMAPFDFGL